MGIDSISTYSLTQLANCVYDDDNEEDDDDVADDANEDYEIAA